MRVLFAILLFVSLPAAVAADGPSIRIRLAVAGDRGRDAVLIEGIPPSQAQPAAAALLGCAVERSGAGFRCAERRIKDGLALQGRFAFTEALALLGRAEAPVQFKVPASPLSSGLAARTFMARPGTVLAYRAGFEWPALAASIAALPLLLWCLFRWPDRRWAWSAGVAALAGWMGGNGQFGLAAFFSQVPSMDGALLRWLSLAPLFLLFVGQARWLAREGADWRLWSQFLALVLIRPRSAEWMTAGEAFLAEAVTLLMLALMATSLLARGRDGAFLPEPLHGALRGRLRALGGNFDIRLDRRPEGREARASGPRLGTLVKIPPSWLTRLEGPALEAAILLACARTHAAPLAVMLGGTVVIWYALQWLAGWATLAPLLATGWFTWCEAHWAHGIERGLREAAAEPAAIQQALWVLREDWGDAAVERLLGRHAV
ncbi:MAG: hypothetical protein IT162_18390 [Bryobacterales bacterium]|nr:hypothetical protein [Bryobacterales bacterium]